MEVILLEHVEKLGKIDVLINNAGFMLPFNKFENYTEKEIEEIIKPFMKDVYGEEYNIDMDTDYALKVNTYQEGLDKIKNEHTLCSYQNTKENFIFELAYNIVLKSRACQLYLKAKYFKIYIDEYEFFNVGRYLKTNNGDGREIVANMIYINLEGRVDTEHRLIIVEDAPNGKKDDNRYDVSVSSTYQVEIMDLFKPNHGVLSWFPVRDFDFDINYSSYGQYTAFRDECKTLSKKVTYSKEYHIKDTYADSDSRSTLEDTTYGIKEIAKSPFFDDFGNSLDNEYDYYLEQIHPTLCLMSKTTPYISKWGYYDEQKDSCENPYRLNVSKVFGTSNLSANTYLNNCIENEYTHSMPYYMTLDMPNYYKDYQYIYSGGEYKNHYVNNTTKTEDGSENDFETFTDCVEYWINTFKRTDVDKFSEFFSGKKYGKRFDRKYSRLMGGDKFHNPYTLFRGVKFEAVRQFNGVEKRSSEYNDYKFTFVYIPVMLNSLIFNSTVHFVKNDTFKFIVGIIFVNTMLGKYQHNIFGGGVDYFNKGFLYASCQDIIRPENDAEFGHNLTLEYVTKSEYGYEKPTVTIQDVINDVWKKNYDISKEENIFHMWVWDNNQVIVTKTRNFSNSSTNMDVIGEFEIDDDFEGGGVEMITEPLGKYQLYEIQFEGDGDKINVLWDRYYEDYDTTIYGYKTFEYYGSIECKLGIPHIEFKNVTLVDVCDIDWKYYGGNDFGGYELDVSNLHFKSESLQNILINLADEKSIISIRVFNTDSNAIDMTFGKDQIKVDVNVGDVEIDGNTILETSGSNGESINNLKIDITIEDKFDTNYDSLGFKNYFSIFNQLSAYSISENINNDYNIKYYSTVEDNKYKIRVVDPDSIEIEDRYEVVPVKVTQNNKNVFGSVEIKEKENVDKIGIKVINRYSGFYNPIFNDILYYDDYTYTKTVGRLRNAIEFELPYSNTNIDYTYNDGYGEFGVIKNMYYHKTNVYRSDKILTSKKHIYPAINEYAIDYRNYNIFSSSWDEGYFISQDDLDNRSICDGIGSMKDGLCMFGSKYLNLPDTIFIDTFANGKEWFGGVLMDIRDNTDVEVIYKEINNKTVKYHIFIEKRLKRYFVENLMGVFSKYINKNYSFGNKGTIEDDVAEYVEKNILSLYKVDKIYMYIKGERMRINDKRIENEYLKYMNQSNDVKIKNGFPIAIINGEAILEDKLFTMSKTNEFDRDITYNLNNGFKESFGFGVSIKRK